MVPRMLALFECRRLYDLILPPEPHSNHLCPTPTLPIISMRKWGGCQQASMRIRPGGAFLLCLTSSFRAKHSERRLDCIHRGFPGCHHSTECRRPYALHIGFTTSRLRVLPKNRVRARLHLYRLRLIYFLPCPYPQTISLFNPKFPVLTGCAFHLFGRMLSL